jgi:Na+/H+ antiporter NhaD/arsenite permease-like protein
MEQATIALAIFALTYLLIISEMVHKTVAALLGALLMIVYGLVDYNSIGSLIDFRTLTVVLGIFITINVVEISGLFEYISVKALKFTKGDPIKLLSVVIILAITISVIFTEIPTAIILGTLMIKICKRINLSPIPYLIAIAMVVDMGGLLTPISSLQNIMIASVVNIKFSYFTLFMLPLWIALLIGALFFFRFIFKKQLQHKLTKEELDRMMALDENAEIKNKKLFFRSLIILTLIVVFFFIQDYTGIGSEAVAMTGAILMLLLSSVNPDEVFAKIEWSILAFFIGLFIVIGGVEKAGWLEQVALMVSHHMHGTMSATVMTIFTSTFISSFIDNIPVVAMLIPIAQRLTEMFAVKGFLLFFAIAAGTNIGGNITPIGSPSNVIILGIAEKEKKPIRIAEFIKVGALYTLLNIIITLVYFFIRITLA